ncbi:MAG: GIY-YIG nuclease family protein [Acidobacteria bacterium]|nr:GIY-YIG nuclease family protein [Acidobacteriota bacterium]
MSNRSKTLYIGMTNSLDRRVAQRKSGEFQGLTSRYKLDRLVYFQEYSYVHSAIAREKQLKRWVRRKKIELIVSVNSDWRDLAKHWGRPLKCIDPSTARR